MNYFDDQSEEEDFKDQPDEVVEGQRAPPVEIKIQRPPAQPKLDEEPEYQEDEDSGIEAEEDVSAVLTDARLRLEQGKLYELIMKHNLFEGVEADERAMKNVQKEIRAYAQERMEIMLGMRQEQPKEIANSFPMEMFPFNSLEVETLKALASAATKGASRDAEPIDLGPQKPPARTSLNPIGKGVSLTRPVLKPTVKAQPLAKKPQTQFKREANARIQRILEEEGLSMEDINEVFDPNREYLDRKKLAKMTEDEVIERNRKISLRNRRADNPQAVPMPTAEQMEQAIIHRSAVAEAQKPGWRELIGMVKAMPPTKNNNEE